MSSIRNTVLMQENKPVLIVRNPHYNKSVYFYWIFPILIVLAKPLITKKHTLKLHVRYRKNKLKVIITGNSTEMM